MHRWNYLIPVLLLALPVRAADRAPAEPSPDTLNLVVMDPLAAELACACVAGYAQRDYGQFGAHLERSLERPVKVTLAESLSAPAVRALERIDVVIGKYSVVEADAMGAGLKFRSLAMLTDLKGEIHQTGLFVVRGDDPAKGLADLEGYRMLFGPAEAIEKQAAALASMEAFELPIPENRATSPGCSSAVVSIIENEADAAVVSSYAMPLLEGCGAIEKGELRLVGKTDPVPFITVFVRSGAGSALERALGKALAAVAGEKQLLQALESRDGFVPLPPLSGSGREAPAPNLPEDLPVSPRVFWSRVLAGASLAGLAVAGDRLLVADKSLDGEQDLFRCLDADTGAEHWRLSCPAKVDIDFTKALRANPVVYKGLVSGDWSGPVCPDASDLKLRWTREDGSLEAFSRLMAGKGRVLAVTRTGNRLYIRNALAVYCFVLE